MIYLMFAAFLFPFSFVCFAIDLGILDPEWFGKPLGIVTGFCGWLFLILAQPKKTICPGCGGRGGWEDGDEGQWVTCSCVKDHKPC